MQGIVVVTPPPSAPTALPARPAARAPAQDKVGDAANRLARRATAAALIG